MTVQIWRIGDHLPQDFERLQHEAAAEGVRNMELIASDWCAGRRFQGPGQGLFAAYSHGKLAGVGGMTPCPDVPGAIRMRRFYVSPAHRRLGVGRALAAAVMQEGLQIHPYLSCNARATSAAGPFWEAMGFVPDKRPGITHIYGTSAAGSGRPG